MHGGRASRGGPGPGEGSVIRHGGAELILVDAREQQDGQVLDFDVVVIGGGMAGITIADQLRSTGRRIGVIEGGGVDPARQAQRLFAGVTAGQPYFALDRCRFRVLGGSSIRWGGWCRPLDDSDFEAREWIPLSGWPISAMDLAPYWARAAHLVGLESESFALADWRDRIPAPPSTGDPYFQREIIQHGRGDFGELYRPMLESSPNVTALLHASVVELSLEPGTERVSMARVKTHRGTQLDVRGDVFVLAGGGIENARLLLASRAARAAGLGNESDFVGRCFMEHLHVPAGHVMPRPGLRLDPFFHGAFTAGERAHGVLVPTESTQRAHRMPTCSIGLDTVPCVTGTSPWLSGPPALTTGLASLSRRLSRSRPVLQQRARRVGYAGWRITRCAETWLEAQRAGRWRHRLPIALYARAEQTPNPDSRVTLDGRRDELGLPRPRLDWRLRETDVNAVTRWLALLDTSLQRSGRGRVQMPGPDWTTRIIGGPHHMGTTRMSSRPQDGVVDADCRVHSVSNLYVAGSSVFATGGHANPSLTLLALSLRLADHLRIRLNGGG